MLSGRAPSVLRTPLLLGLLLALHGLAGNLGEGLRLVMLRAVAGPVPRGETADLGPVSDDLRERAQGALEHGKAVEQSALIPLLDVDLRRGWAIIGGGVNRGVVPGARVAVKGACVGVIDRVTDHLARLRLLSSAETQVPVFLSRDGAGRPLPQDLERLVGIARGTGDGAALASAHLPEAFLVGDRLHALRSEGGPDHEPPLLVGTVAELSLQPRIELAGRLEGAPGVWLEGATDPEDPAEEGSAGLFGDREVAVSMVGRGRVRGALLIGDLSGVLAGSAAQSGGRFLGRVERRFGGVAHVVGPTDAGVTFDVLVAASDTGAVTSARLRGSGRGRLQVVEGEMPVGAEEVLLVTAGGQELVPAGLIVGMAHLSWPEGGEWPDIRLQEAPAWPNRVSLSVFRYSDERDRLRGRSR